MVIIYFFIKSDKVTIEGQNERYHLVVNVGDFLELTCHAHGVPKPTITWLKDAKEHIIDSERVLNHGELFRIDSAAVS